MHIRDIEPFLKTEGELTARIAGVPISFSMRNRHERNYAAKLFVNVRYPQSDIDSEIFRFLIRDGDRVLDAGANIGFTALEMLEAGAKEIIAVEPVSELYGRLSELATPLIIPLNVALADKQGEGNIAISVSHNQGSSIKDEMITMFPEVFGDVLKRESIRIETIDTISHRYGESDVWKLDIEGAEVDALKGAAETLRSKPPRVVIAELYDTFFDDFKSEIIKTHPFAYRAFLEVHGAALALVPIDEVFDAGKYEITSPMYIFSRQELIEGV
ncbi:FkbM family methyltransferase [Pseudoxanthomonas winnipegensis]|nr:FkbM family methyltransferase [Pseudoxanthomonas winnipegensis]